MKPGGDDSAAGGQCRSLLRSQTKDILRDLFAQCRLARSASRHAQNPGGMTRHKLAERLLLAVLGVGG